MQQTFGDEGDGDVDDIDDDGGGDDDYGNDDDVDDDDGNDDGYQFSLRTSVTVTSLNSTRATRLLALHTMVGKAVG